MAQLDEIVSKSTIQGIIDADTEIVKLDNDFKNLLKTAKELANGIGSNVDSFAKLKAVQDQTIDQTKKLTEAEKQAEKVAKDQAEASKQITKAVELEANSIAALRKQNSELTKQRNLVNTATKEGQKQIRELNKQIDANNKVIKGNVDTLTKQKINVGNYISSWGPFQGVANMVTQGIGIMKIAFISLKAALISTGIGALVVLLGSLYTYFTRSGEGADKFAKFMAQVRAVVDVLIDRFAKFGEGIALIFTGNFKEGAEKISQTFKGIGEEMRQEVKTAGEIADKLDEIDDKRRTYQEQIAKNQIRIAQLEEIARNKEDYSLEQRKAAIDEIMGLKRADAAMTKELNQAEVDQINKQGEMRMLNDEEQQKLTDARIKLMNEEAAAQSDINSSLKLRNTIYAGIAEQEGLMAEANRKTLDEIGKTALKLGGLDDIIEETFDIPDPEQEVDPWITALEEIKKFAEDAYNNTTEANRIALEKKQADIEEFHRLGLISEEEYQAALAKLRDDENKVIDQERQDKITAAQQTGEILYGISQMFFNLEMSDIEKKKEQELKLAGDNAVAREAIEKKYDDQMKKLKTKQAKADKGFALFGAIINVARAVSTAMTAGPGIGLILAALTAALGAIQIGIIATQPIPQFSKGTESAPDGLISVAEQGRELIKTKSGKVLMANKRTILSGMKGAQIYSNKETEDILKLKNVGYDSSELRRTLESNNDKLIRTIKNKKEIHITPAQNSRITERQGDYYKTYFKRKLG